MVRLKKEPDVKPQTLPINICTADVNISSSSEIAASGATVASVRRHSADAAGVVRPSYSNSGMKELLHGKFDSVSEVNSAGFVGAGFRWWQRQRERRRRESLERQVEQQRRRLEEASGGENHRQSLKENTTFQQLSNSALPDGTECSEQGVGVRVSNPTTTPSGNGMSVSVEVEDVGTDLWIPEVRIKEEPPTVHPFCPFILTKDQMLCIAKEVLPAGVAYCRWSRLYSLARDGDSFDAFLRRVEGAPRTLLVIKTTRGSILGGYADSPWESQHHSLAVSAGFYGSAQACLFSIVDESLCVYKWTGVNRYIQLCDVGHKMLAFGGGGGAGTFGLCIEQDFQRGSTGTCDTFANEPLCDQENFDVLDVEAWAFLTGQF